MGALIRAKDWAATPLGPPETWPQSLRTSVSTCLNCSFPILIWWGPELVKIYNDAYAEILAGKHPRALGMPGQQVWPEIWDTIGPMLGRVMSQGEATPADDLRLVLHRNGYPEECYFSFSYSPVRDEAGRIAGVFTPVIETTRRVFGERRAQFLLELDGALRKLSDPEAVKIAACRMLGEHLGVAQAGYAEATPDGEHVLIEGEWNRGEMPSTTGLHRLVDYGPSMIAELQAGEAVRIVDVATDPRTRSPDNLKTYRRRSISALMNIPLVKSGRLTAVLFVHQVQPRSWSDYELVITHEIAERTWSAVQRANVEAALRRSEAEFRALGEHLPNLCWMANADGWIYWYNQGWYDYTGTTQAGMEGWGWQSVHDPAVLSTVMERWTGCIAAGAPFEMTFPLRAADGAFHPFLTRIVPVRDEAGDIIKWFGSNVDISEQLRTERELRDSQARLQAIFDTVPVSIAFAEAPSGRLTFGNAAIDKIFRHPMRYSTEIEDYNEWEAYHASGRRVEGHEFPMAKALKSGLMASGEYQFRCGDGVLRWIMVTSAPLFDSEGGVSGAVAVCADTDDLRRAEIILSRDKSELERIVAERTGELEAAQSQLAHAQRMEALGQLAGGIAHDFNNVIQAVQGGARLIERRPGDVERVLSLARMIVESAGRGAAITRRLLTFSRRNDLRAEPVDCATLLNGMQEILTHTLGAGIRVKVQADASLPCLKADKGQLETVLVNLAANARDAMPGSGTLSYTATLDVFAQTDTDRPNLKAGSYICLSVKDTGAGMTPDVLARASEPFFTTKEVGQGTGLGLAMARGFTEQSGGGLRIESEAGSGTVVKLWFPVADEGTPNIVPPAPSATEPPASARARLLMVDDEPAVRNTLSQQMEDEGFVVLVAESGADALALLHDGATIDLIIADLSMPEMDGLTLVQEVQSRLPGLPAILLTGYASNAAEIAMSGAMSGRFTLLRKPVEGPALAERVDVMLEGATTTTEPVR